MSENKAIAFGDSPAKLSARSLLVRPIFTPTFREHLLWWAKKDKSKINKILDLIEVVCEQPFKGIGVQPTYGYCWRKQSISTQIKYKEEENVEDDHSSHHEIHGEMLN